MALNGVFQPYNKREDLTRLANIYVLVVIFVLPTSICFCMAVLFVFPLSNVLGLKMETDLMDWLNCAEDTIWLIVGSGVGCMYIFGAIMMCVDQVYYVSKLCHLINECILGNTSIIVDYFLTCIQLRQDQLAATTVARSSHLEVPIMMGDPLREASFNKHERQGLSKVAPASSYEQVDRQINLTLMHTLLHYKIFIEQLRSHLEPFRLFTTAAVLLMFALPVTTRLFIAYLDRTQMSLCLLVSVFMLLIIDSSLVTICWLHERLLNIYRHLQGLIAHTAALIQWSRCISIVMPMTST